MTPRILSLALFMSAGVVVAGATARADEPRSHKVRTSATVEVIEDPGKVDDIVSRLKADKIKRDQASPTVPPRNPAPARVEPPTARPAPSSAAHPPARAAEHAAPPVEPQQEHERERDRRDGQRERRSLPRQRH